MPATRRDAKRDNAADRREWMPRKARSADKLAENRHRAMANASGSAATGDDSEKTPFLNAAWTWRKTKEFSWIR